MSDLRGFRVKPRAVRQNLGAGSARNEHESPVCDGFCVRQILPYGFGLCAVVCRLVGGRIAQNPCYRQWGMFSTKAD